LVFILQIFELFIIKMISAYKDEQIYTLNQRRRKTIQTSFCNAVVNADFNSCSLAASLHIPDAVF